MRTPLQWIEDTIKQHSQVFRTTKYNNQYYEHIYQFADALAKDKYSSIQFISSFDQSSFASTYEGERVIFFDVVQSQLLKNAFKQIVAHDDFLALADTLKKAGCLYILDRDYHFSSVTFRHPVIAFTNYYLIDETKVEQYKPLLGPLKTIALLPEFSELLDNFIIGHEMAHLLINNGYFPASNKIFYMKMFERTLEKCCYENEPNFEKIARYYGELDNVEMNLEDLKNDLIIRRKHYLANQTYLAEEMECDLFSFQYLLDYYFKKDPKEIDRHLDFACTFFMIFSVFDLHYAMIRRFDLSERRGIDALKPGGIADMHFRKVALLDGMIAYILKRNSVLEVSGEREFIRIYDDFRQAMFQFKKAIDGLYLMPVTKAIHAILKNVETMKDQIPSKLVREDDVRSLLERITRNDGMFNQEELDKIFKQD